MNIALYRYVKNLYLIGLHAWDTNDEDLDCILWEIGNLLYIRRSFNDGGWEIPA
jgi:hypothetical protein